MKTLVILTCCLVTCQAVWAQEKKPAPTTDTVLEKCVKILKEGDLYAYSDPTPEHAAIALGLLGDERAVPALTERLEKTDSFGLKIAIIKALGWIKSPKAVPALEKVFKDDERAYRKQAARALKAITGRTYETDKK